MGERGPSGDGTVLVGVVGTAAAVVVLGAGPAGRAVAGVGGVVLGAGEGVGVGQVP